MRVEAAPLAPRRRNGAAAPLAPPLGELSPQVTERVSRAGYPLRRLIAASSPKGRAKGRVTKAVTNRESPMVYRQLPALQARIVSGDSPQWRKRPRSAAGWR